MLSVYIDFTGEMNRGLNREVQQVMQKWMF